MQEMTQDVMQIIEDLQMTRYKRKQNGVGEAEKDRYGYPFEPVSAFSTKPLEFVETAMRLDIEATEIFSELSRLNRFSPLYYRLSGQFERLLRQLGSCCITKAMIEQREKESFELLQDLTIEKLRKMAAFNFRKCFAAFMDSRSRGNCCCDAFEFSIRWSALDKRLIATEEKIKSGQLSVPGTQKKLPIAPSGTGPVGTTGCQQVQSPMALAEKGRALPVLEGTVCAEPAVCRSELSEESRNQVSESREQGTDIRGQVSGFSDQENPMVTMGTVPESTDLCRKGMSPIEQSEDEEKQFMREILLGEALDRGDRKAYETVVQTPDSGLETLWRDFLERDAQSSCSFLEKIGLFGDAPDDPPPEEEWPELFEPAAIELLEN